jgi:ubiquinone/menaquinone biosynthesis C-methylase UbiE
VIEWAARYDVLAWLLTKGRENQLRERMLSLAGLGPGHHVLDVGCGTGTLAIAAARRVGISGVVHGIDASPPMIARARRKAAKASVAVDFDVAVAEALPFPGHQFDIVLSTLMLHHLPRKTRQQCAMEIARILKIGGRVLAVDFGRGHRRGFMSHIHRHGHVDIKDIVALLEDAGLTVIDNGAVGMNNLHFALAENSKNMRSPDRQGA